MRMNADERKSHILCVACAHAVQRGYQHIPRADVAIDADVSESLINNYFGTMDALRDAVVIHAVQWGNMPIIGQAVASRHPAVKDLPRSTKQRALASLI